MSRAQYVKTRHPGVYYRVLVNGERRYTIMVSERGKASYRVVPGGEQDAIRARADLLTRKGRGEKIAPSKIRFGAYATQWLDAEKHRLDERTIDDYDRQLRLHLIPAFGHLKLSGVNEDRIAELIREKSETHTGASVASMLTPLSRILNRAVRQGAISQNPMRRLEREERPKIRKRERRILDRAEIAALLKACPERYRALVASAVFTGLRISELLGLVWGDIDLDRGVVTVRAQLSRITRERKDVKTANAEREVLLAPQIVAELRRVKLSSGHSADRDFVFCTEKGRPFSQTNVLRRGLHAACLAAQLREPRPRFHDLRHTYASLVIADPRSTPAFLARQLGHSDPAFTMRTYVEVWERREREEVHRAVLSDALGSAIPVDGEGRLIEGGFGG